MKEGTWGGHTRSWNLVGRLVVYRKYQTAIGISVVFVRSDMVIILRSRMNFNPNQNPGMFLGRKEEFGEIVRVPDHKETI